MDHSMVSGFCVPAPTELSMAQRSAEAPAAQEEEVAASFEAMFVQQLLKGMRQSSMAGNKEFGRQTFEDMFDEQIAKAVASQGLGVGEALFAGNAGQKAQETGAAVDSRLAEPR